MPVSKEYTLVMLLFKVQSWQYESLEKRGVKKTDTDEVEVGLYRLKIDST